MIRTILYAKPLSYYSVLIKHSHDTQIATTDDMTPIETPYRFQKTTLKLCVMWVVFGDNFLFIIFTLL